MLIAAITRWLQDPRPTAWQAVLCGLFAIWIPTVLRMAVDGVVTGCEFTPYLPFVLICAVALRVAGGTGRLGIRCDHGGICWRIAGV